MVALNKAPFKDSYWVVEWPKSWCPTVTAIITANSNDNKNSTDDNMIYSRLAAQFGGHNIQAYKSLS